MPTSTTADRPRGVGDPPLRYGDYPELFWDLQPDAEIDLDHPLIVARVLREGNLRHVRELVPLEVLRKHLPDIFIPEHVRLFWTRVLELRETEPRRSAGA
ncbi:MAG TPA: hypothetical protein VHG91_07850 [Longimicrobium sp.]|nr:hypothetical protein [Longimicrobium sp.]